MNVAGSTVLVSGATGGIGGAIARELAAGGARVVLVGRDRARTQSLADEIVGIGARAEVLIADLENAALVEPLIASALARVDRIDCLINSVGVQNFGFFADQPAAASARLFAINTVAPVALIRAVLPHMIANGSGRIVNIGSIFGSIGFPCFASYSASKFALRGFSEALRRELAGSGVGVTYVAPRFTRTGFNRGAVARMAEALGMAQDEPEAVARQVLDAVRREGCNRYLGWPEKFFVRVNSLIPRLVDRALKKQVERMRPFATRELI